MAAISILFELHILFELAGRWVRFGPFEKAFDFFGTGLFWTVQALGHMPGNLCAVVHKGKDEWIVLGSDCCHSRYEYFYYVAF